MAQSSFDVVTVGNALVDVLAYTSEDDITRLGMTKGAMMLVEADRAHALYDKMPPGVEMSGGSAANTAVGVASLGGRAAYIGKVAADQLGQVFRHDITAAGVSYEVPTLSGAATGRCLVLPTPAAHRTMKTFLGASRGMRPEDVDEKLVATASVTFVEAYLWDSPSTKAAALHAIDIARRARRKVSLTLSDPFCVDRH